MSFEVDAFMGMPAAPPPARAEAPRASEGPSFDDHLEEANAEPEVENTKPVEHKAKETPEQPEQPTATPATPTPPPQPQAPIVIQLIADAPPVAEAPVEADAAIETPELAPQAPSAPAPVAPVKAEAAKSDTPQPSAETPVDATTQTKSDASAKSDAPVKPDATKADAPVVEDALEAPTTQAPAPQPEPAQQPQPQLLAQAVPTPAPTPRIATPVAETDTANAESDAAAAPEAPSAETPADTRPKKADLEPGQDAAKANTAPSSNTKDSFAALAALAAQEGGDQLQAPTPTTPATAIAGTELTPQSGQVAAENVARAAPAAAQVSREIIRRFNGQTTSFELRLDPPELGKVEIRLEVSRDHKVTAVVAAENPAALAELARNARDLQQALQSAGLDLSDKGLSFDLKQQRESRADSEGGSSRSNTGGDEAAPTPAPAPSRPIGLESWRGVRVDLVA